MIPGGNTYTSLLLSMMMLYVSKRSEMRRSLGGSDGALVLLLEEYSYTNTY